MCLDIGDSAKQCYESQKSNIRVKSRTMELKEEPYNIGLAFMWKNLRELINIAKDRM
jgi:hypothetical protein